MSTPSRSSPITPAAVALLLALTWIGAAAAQPDTSWVQAERERLLTAVKDGDPDARFEAAVRLATDARLSRWDRTAEWMTWLGRDCERRARPVLVEAMRGQDPDRRMRAAPAASMQANYSTTYPLTFTYNVPGASVEKVVLVAPGSVTHHSDMHQRYVPLATFLTSEADLTFTTPKNSTYAPRGYYLLFLVTDHGIPSVGQFVQLQ